MALEVVVDDVVDNGEGLIELVSGNSGDVLVVESFSELGFIPDGLTVVTSTSKLLKAAVVISTSMLVEPLMTEEIVVSLLAAVDCLTMVTGCLTVVIVTEGVDNELIEDVAVSGSAVVVVVDCVVEERSKLKQLSNLVLHSSLSFKLQRMASVVH